MRVFKQTTPHGFPQRIRTPRFKSRVRILMSAGMACDETLEVIIPAKTVGMRDTGRWNGGTCDR